LSEAKTTLRDESRNETSKTTLRDESRNETSSAV
jgi:hypothetical protein